MQHNYSATNIIWHNYSAANIMWHNYSAAYIIRHNYSAANIMRHNYSDAYIIRHNYSAAIIMWHNYSAAKIMRLGGLKLVTSLATSVYSILIESWVVKLLMALAPAERWGCLKHEIEVRVSVTRKNRQLSIKVAQT